MNELEALHALADAYGVATAYTDGLKRRVEVQPETLVAVCASLGAQLDSASGAEAALAARKAAGQPPLPPVLVAWDGVLPSVRYDVGAITRAQLRLQNGDVVPLHVAGDALHAEHPLPLGYHRLVLEVSGSRLESAVLSAPTKTWRPAGETKGWGLGTHLSALRSTRSRSLGDLRDLARLGEWIGSQGGDLVTVLPLLPTFNQAPAEPSPYSPVSRLFWSELILDLGESATGAHSAHPAPTTLDVTAADAEVRAALVHWPVPDPSAIDEELARYARFRGAQTRLGRDWRQWPADARTGHFRPDHIDPAEERFHLVAQTAALRQLDDLTDHLQSVGVRLGLDLAVGSHPDGYDPWSRPHLFVDGMSVGAPPDPGFPSGQDWGFSPVLPSASRQEGHAYMAACIAHQAAIAGVLRVDHIMALARLYWIPRGAGKHDGTYVKYPTDELFAILSLESHRHECEIVGEDLGTVPKEIEEALSRHRIRGMFLTQFEASREVPEPPQREQVALIGSHDTPTLAGWIDQSDIDERVRLGLLPEAASDLERALRVESVQRLANVLGERADDLPGFLEGLLKWLGSSPSPLVIPWIEDLWLEVDQVNLPGTSSVERANWQRPMSRLLDEVIRDPHVIALVRTLHEARSRGGT